MKKLLGSFTFVFAFLVVSFLTVMAVAQVTAPPETVEEATALIPKLIEAILQGNYNVIAGVVLMILMVVVRQYGLPKWNIDTKVLPIITALIAALAACGLSMFNNVGILEALKTGLTIAIFAGGTWSLIGKYIVKKILGSSYEE